ncbi:MAG: YihA family ribosome biogenesis GTP-binding protein [Clostridia bacterium]|nr:YihA family ribosome biogenesis GTP-binding protein [Clostridia bacterium]
MRIKNAKFIKSVADTNLPNDLQEIAFCGRSNVGKSTLINALCNQNKLAKTSSTPGKTRLINYFSINNDQFYLVDLPGYGYHKAGKSYDDKWSEILENYILNSQKLKLCLLLLDIRHTPSREDFEMIRFLSYNQIPFVIIATKADKLSKAQIGNAKLKLASETKLGPGNIIPVSSDKRYNLDKIEDILDNFIEIEN